MHFKLTKLRKPVLYDKIYFVVVTCPPTSLENGEVFYFGYPVDGGYPVGTISPVQCNDGYYPTELPVRRCLISGQWTQPTLECIFQSNQTTYYSIFCQKSPPRKFL